MLLIDALYINNSGGKVLLDYLIKSSEAYSNNTYYLLDKRCEGSYDFIPEDRRVYLPGKLYLRHTFYKKNIEKFTKVFCFGNIPPTIKTGIPVYTYFHNVSIFDHPETYRWKEKLVKRLKGKIISYLAKNSAFFIVQSQNVKNLLIQHVELPQNQCLVLPFYNVQKCTSSSIKQESFAFISNGNTHKNHNNLLDAWIELFNRGLSPELHLTVTSNHIALVKRIDEAVKGGVKITNHGYTDSYRLYEKCKYLVYPSLCESFGLGLIEAVESGCDVVASNLPYVYEVVEPTATFDPVDYLSIADTVEQVLSRKAKKKTSLIVDNKIQDLLKILNNETTHPVI